MTEVNPQEYDFSTDLAIDPEALDVEWLQQPSLYVKYSTLASKARQEMEEAKDKIDLVKAEIDKEIRDNPTKFTGEDKKPTEAQITSLVTQDKRFKEANSEYNELRLNFNILMGIVTGMDHKKSALENQEFLATNPGNLFLPTKPGLAHQLFYLYPKALFFYFLKTLQF